MKRSTLVGIQLMAAVLIAAGWGTTAHAVAPMLKDMEDAFIHISDQVRPCVVNIDVEGAAPEGMSQRMEGLDDLFRFFGMPAPEPDDDQAPQAPQQQPRQPRHRAMPHVMGSGSGFIYQPDGYIITNNHVVERADKIKVRLSSGEEYDAKVVGTDPDTDVAVIKIEPKSPLPVATLGDSDKVRVGQFAIALGSPRGLEGSVSFGHISALGRHALNLPSQMRFQNFIQTDAAINLGNSGGPLTNIDGEVVGINTAIVYGAQSLGFAIPINVAKKVVPELIGKGKITRGYLGVKIVKPTKDLREALTLPDEKGAFVDTVMPDSPAAKAGIKEYDLIRKVNGQAIESDTDLVSKISDLAPGSKATVEVIRDGAPKELSVTLDEFQTKSAIAKAQQPGNAVLGLRVQNLTSDIAEHLGQKPDVKGALVVDVEPDSPAFDAGIRQGDIIIEIGKKQVKSADDFHALMKEMAVPGKPLLVRVVKGPDGPHIILIKVPAETKK